MKNRININFWTLFLFVGLSVPVLLFNSCADDNDDGSTTPVKIEKVFLENAQSTMPDRDLSLFGNFARLGQMIRLQGSGFVGVKQVLINGESCYFNPVFVTDQSMIVQISADVPTVEAPDDVRNTIKLVKSESNTFVFSFEIRAAAPSITDISHTLPQAGDEITITGKGLQGVTSVIFPGNIAAAIFTSDDEEGVWVKVTVPSGITQSGSVLVISANGGAYSPAYFNYREGLVHDFDNVQNYSWGSGVDNTALTAQIPASGNLPKSQGGYQVFNPTGSLAANSDQRFWLNSTAIFGSITNFIPGATAAADCGIQMDIYVEGVWNSGIIRMVMADGSGASRYCMLYRPVYVNNTYSIESFVNPGAWFTITLPFSLSADYEGKTLDDVIASMSAASYKQAGPWFENSGITDVFDPVPATEKVYFDNIRFVPLTTPTYSDFPDEE
ncbi:MAG: glycan-binding surface protein [Dysgonamonadaceae bacterium]|jgi:hypothetical protein|nr:glycan-binding surface protein [Dysgonamonadaceae bacterium]